MELDDSHDSEHLTVEKYSPVLIDEIAIFLTPETEEFKHFDRTWYVVHVASEVDSDAEVCVHFMGPHAETRGKRKRRECSSACVVFSLAWTDKHGIERYRQTEASHCVASTAWVPVSSVLWCGIQLDRGMWGKLPPALLRELPVETYKL